MSQHYFIFNIAGGVGKNIMATATIEAIKKANPKSKIIVTSPWGIVWENNPHIEKCVSLEQVPNFYSLYIKDKDCTILRLDPYNADDFFHHRKSLIEIWCDLCETPYKGELPALYYTDDELKAIKAKLDAQPLQTSGTRPDAAIGKWPPPLFFIQPSGGAANQTYPISWARDLPIITVNEIVKRMNAEGFRTIHLRRENQLAIPGADWIPFTQREAMGAIKFSDKRLFVDSFGAHAAAAWKLPSVVPWVVNSPKVYGYKMHMNILPESKEVFHHRMNSYLEPYDIMGQWHEHPYETDQIFSADKIMKLLLK